MTEEQSEMVKKCLQKIPTLVKELGLENGYRLVINQGEDAGQTVFHLHIHILSGQKMGWTPA
jgi:diadenosine tetraphosphate (Ap4A) HIT family hydrolase